MRELVLMGFFAEVEMGRDGVLEEVDDQIADEDQERGPFPPNSRLVGTTSTSAVESMNPGTQRHKYLRYDRSQFRWTMIAPPKMLAASSRQAEENTCQGFMGAG